MTGNWETSSTFLYDACVRNMSFEGKLSHRVDVAVLIFFIGNKEGGAP